MIGYDVAIHADNHTRAQRALERFLRPLLRGSIAKQPAKERIVHKRKLLRHADALIGADRYHCRRYFADHLGIRILRPAIRRRRKTKRLIGAASFASREHKSQYDCHEQGAPARIQV